MFVEWGFLISEMVLLEILAALLGLIVGWVIWGRARVAMAPSDSAEAERLRAELARCEGRSADYAAKLAELETALSDVRAGAVTPAQAKPAMLTAPRDGKADDLKRIKGVGPKLEALLHSLGFYHFDQVAAWTEAEVAWVDENLEGFKGRVSRDGWVAQAKELAKG